MSYFGKFSKFAFTKYRKAYINVYNYFIKFKNGSRINFLTGLKELNEIKIHSLKRSDINDHLVNLFVESIHLTPRVIVELGVRGGESTFVLERVAKLFDSYLISVDIMDCSDLCSYKKWLFIKEDNIKFARLFRDWCKENNLKPEIDLLFIDTSHKFEHTLEEIKYWFPFLSKKSIVFFHDTNLRKRYKRLDGSIGFGWDNNRGVIRALENFFQTSFNENSNFIDFRNGWLIKHYANCNGFTILERIVL